jgi:ribulose-5-phosphate 4-epimerase/fuculose-1-phosphate aldolase
VKVDLEARIVMESPHPINPAGFTIHSAVHAAREDAHCVLHLHTEAGVAVSAQREGLRPVSQQAAVVLTSLGYHDYEGLALNEDEKPRLVRDLGDNTFLILRNHGLLTVGPTVADAFLSMFLLERACRIQIGAQSGKGELVEVARPILDGMKEQTKVVLKGLGGALVWPGLLRMLDRRDPSFRD